MDGVFVSGEPVLFMGRDEAEWKDRIRRQVPEPLTRPRLEFTVASFRRRGHRFDLDNLCKPVLDVVAGGHIVSVWATVVESDAPGVRISEEEPLPPLPQGRTEATIADPPAQSVRNDEPLPELAGVAVIGNDQPLGCHLAFGDPNTRIGVFGFEGPIKPLIDSLWPLLGGEPHRPADHRIRDLRVVRDGRVEGVAVRVWPLPR